MTIDLYKQKAEPSDMHSRARSLGTKGKCKRPGVPTLEHGNEKKKFSERKTGGSNNWAGGNQA